MICRDYELCKIPRKSIWTIDIYILYTMMITSFYIRFSSNQSVENLLLLRTSGLFWYSNSPARRVHQVWTKCFQNRKIVSPLSLWGHNDRRTKGRGKGDTQCQLIDTLACC